MHFEQSDEKDESMNVGQAPSTSDFYDSDEEKDDSNPSGAGESAFGAPSKKSTLAEEDPLYDPHADEEDEAWMRARVQRSNVAAVAAQPAQRGGKQQRKNGPGKMALKESAAAEAEAAAAASTSPHLSCPACFTPVCFDCQRHATRSNLFRAMFVADEGIIVDRGRQIRPEVGSEDPDRPQMKFYAVLCKTCKTHLAAMDEDEVFHFFNVLESHA